MACCRATLALDTCFSFVAPSICQARIGLIAGKAPRVTGSTLGHSAGTLPGSSCAQHDGGGTSLISFAGIQPSAARVNPSAFNTV